MIKEMKLTVQSDRLLVLSTGQFPHVFDDAVLDNIKKWVMDDIATSGAANESNWKHLGKNKPTDVELLRTYSIGLLAIALNGYYSYLLEPFINCYGYCWFLCKPENH
jgi:hypothetical protein